MQCLEVSGAVRPIYGSLGVKRLTFTGPCIANIFSEYNQQDATFVQRFTIYLFLYDALHVSDGFSVHHQEHKTAHTGSGICQTDTATWGPR